MINVKRERKLTINQYTITIKKMSEVGELLQEKSMNFAIRIVKLYKWLCDEKKVFVLSKQLLRCGTSIGANIAEAQGAMSKADFAAKVYISSKECFETQFWIELLYKTDFLDEKQYQTIKTDAVELGRILTSITKKIHPRN